MNIRPYLFSILFSALCTLTLQAQTDVWPVQVSGSMLPPYSLNLKVYSLERAEDLSFNVMLRDPVQANLLVRPVITIEQNGSIIYQTDPNYAGKTILLSQFDQMLLNGAGLGEYLSNTALIGATANSTGSIEVPEGFNQICLQMYGVERNVPVSNKFCISGNFRLSQPPQIVKPSFNEKIKMPEVQNFVFSWQPMHIGSPNNPGPVEYTFELVELPMGVMNANDGFASALRVYSTKTMATSFIYTQGEPTLEPNKYYAWRVTATSVMYPTSKLFQNDGKGEVSVFVLYDGDEPGGDVNPFDKASPRGCSVYETSYGPVSKADNEAMIAAPNQNVKVGYFNMKITEAFGSQQQGYSGKGLIEYPMLRSVLEVEFKNIKVNYEGRVYEAESITSIIDSKLKLTPEQLKANVIASNLTGSYAKTLYQSIKNANKVSLLSEGNLKKNALPLALQNEEFPTTMMVVTDIRFTPTNAYLTLIGLDNAENVPAKNIQASDLTISAATAIPSTPFGIKNGTYLVPITNTSSANNVNLTATIMKAVSMDSDSRIYCDCNGYKKPQTKEDLYLSDDIVAQASNGQPLKIAVKDGKQPIASYNGDVKAFPEFTVKGVESYTFQSGGGALNLDPAKSLNGLPSIAATTSPKKLWLQKVTTQLPAKYNIGSSGVVKLSGDMVIGEDDLEYGYFKKSDILPLNKGVIEKWNYSIDEMSMKLEGKKMTGPTIAGKVKLPVSSQTFDYNGTFKDNTRNPVLYVDKLPETLPIEMWSGSMTLEPVSALGLEIKKINEENTVYPNAALTGTFGMQMDKNTFKDAIKGNIAQTKEDMKKVFNLSSDDMDFGVSGIDIENWSFEPYTTKDNKYIPTNLDVSEAQFHINGKSYPITGGQIVYNTDSKERLGLSFTTVAGNNRISFTIWAVAKDGKFVFDGIEENSFELKCDCDTGKAIGMVDFDKIYDDIIRTRFMPHLNNPKHHGGTSSYTSGLSMADAAMYQTFIAALEEETYDGFILVNPTSLRWPMLEQNIDVVSTGSKIVCEKNILLKKEDLNKLGFKADVWLPENYELVISSLTIDKSKPDGQKATLKFKLMPGSALSNTSKSTFLFESVELPVSGTSIQIANVRLNRIANGIATSGDGVTWGATKKNTKDESHAMLDCTKGLGTIELFGLLNVTKLSDPAQVVVRPNGSDFVIPIRADIENVSGRSFDEYIATCMNFDAGNDKLDWSFIVKNQPHIIFKPGSSYEVYYDHHSKKDVSSFDADTFGLGIDGKSYQGLVFKKIESEILSFYKKGGKPVVLELTDGAFATGSGSSLGLYISAEATDVINKEEDANIGGWKYALDSLSFVFEGSELTKNLTLSGSMLLPIFKGEPTNFIGRTFDKGWATFSGEILSSDGKLSSTLGFNDLKDKLYQSVLIPGMGMKLNSSSTVSLEFDNKTNSWNPKGDFSGLCDFFITDKVATAVNIIAPPGIEMHADPIKFENLTVGSEAISGGILFKLDGGVKNYVDLGEWGDVDVKGLTEIDEVQDFRDRVNHVSGSKSAGQSKAMPTQDADKGSTANFLGMELVVTCLGPNQRDGEIFMGLQLAVGIMGSVKENKEDAESKAQFIRAEGVLGIVFRPEAKSQESWSFSAITLECLSVEGALGPVSFAGGLNILRSQEEYGSGLKGFLSAEIEGLGGMTIVGQFGKKEENDDYYYYGFLDLEAFIEQGIPLFYDPITNVPKMDFYGAGGGIQINMRTKKAIDNVDLPKTPAEKAAKAKEKEAAEKRAQTRDFCADLGGDLLQPGIGLSQSYTPLKGSFGGKIFVIFGPWAPVKPPYSIVADAGIHMEIDYNTTTNELSFGEMTISGRGYVFPVSLMERRDNNVGDIYAGVTLDWRNKYIEGEVAFRSSFSLPLIGTTIFSLPENYDETIFASRHNYNKGRLRFGFSPSDPYIELKLGGPGTHELQPISGKFLTNILPLTHTTVKAYAQIGANVDPAPSIEQLIPELEGKIPQKDKDEREEKLKEERPEAKEFGSEQSKGIAFGVTLEQNRSANFYIMRANLLTKAGFDVNLREYKDVTCSNSTDGGQIGLKGWYAKGSAFAYAQGEIEMGFKLFGKEFYANIFDASAYVFMKVQGPNPTSLTGMIAGEYEVMDGLFSGDFNYPVTIGEECTDNKPPDPLADITIYNNASVFNGQTNVDRYNDITLNTNIPLRKDYSLTQKTVDGLASHTINFMADVMNVKVEKVLNRKGLTATLTKYPDPIVSNSFKLRSNAKAIDITFDDALEPLTEYRITYTFGWKEKQGLGDDVSYVSREKPETGSITFTTSARPTIITTGMIEYSAPGNRQRYWHKGYADTEIKFKLKALDDAKSLFPEICSDCGDNPGTKDPVKFNFYAKLQEFDDSGKEVMEKIFPITNYPGKGENARIYDQKSKSIDGKYSISYLEEKIVPVSVASFPELKNFELKKGKIYRLSIIREPNIKILTMGMNTPRIRKIRTDNTSTLLTYYFGVSEYNSLSEKLSQVNIYHKKSILKLRDFNHPSDLYDQDRAAVISKLGESKFHAVADDYYAITLRNKINGEGFDQYDIMRIKRNISLQNMQDYLPEKRIGGDLYNGYAINSDLSKYLSSGSFGTGSSYLSKVLQNITASGQSFGGSGKSSDGTKWGYNISGANDDVCMRLTDSEINQKKKSNKGVYASQYDPLTNSPVFGGNEVFDFLIQDYRSRVIINQMYWLSRIGSYYKSNFFGYYFNNGEATSMSMMTFADKCYPAGEFLNKSELSLSDFAWITDPPPSYKSNTSTYIATETGYRFSYHGETKVSFPSSDQWGELLESKRDNKAEMKQLFTLKPNRTVESFTKTPITNPTELDENNWYTINYNGDDIYAGDKKQKWSTLWAVTRPYSPKDFTYNESQYGLYTLGGGGFLYIRGLSNIDGLKGSYENVWNLSKSSDNKNIIANNYRYINDREINNRNFPTIITANTGFSFKNHGVYRGRRDKNDNNYVNQDLGPRLYRDHQNLKFEEVGLRTFYPDRWYYIQQNDGSRLKDEKGNDKWHVIKERNVFKIVSSGGYYLKAQHWDETVFFGSSYREHRLVLNDKTYPNDKWGDLNHYYRSVWAVIPVANNGDWCFIKNMRYPSCFLTIDGQNNAKLVESAEGDQLKIIEVK